jgi:phosphoserine phosphatase RsbU/P
MRQPALLILGSSPQASANPCVERALAHWTPQRPDPVTATFGQLLNSPALLRDIHFAWLLADAPDAPGLYQVIALLQDRQVPAMLTRPGEVQPLGAAVQSGVVAAPPGAAPAALCAVLRTLWSHAEAVADLHAEVSYLRAHQTGLCGQIDKMDEELRLAARMQREFLPARLPVIEHLDLSVLFRPAGHVSGDIYDIFPVDEDHLGILLVDAVGHGVPAALMTVYLKQSLRVKEIHPGPRAAYRIIPANEALAALNRDVIHHQGDHVLTATAWYGLLNHRTLELRHARAGHPAPILFKADGRVQSLEPEGGLLGVFPEEQYELMPTQLEAGDRLLIYTDGFEVAFRPEGPSSGAAKAGLANRQYLEEFKELAQGPLDEAVGRLAHRLDQQAGSLNQLDDLTVLCVGVRAEAGTAASVPAANALLVASAR